TLNNLRHSVLFELVCKPYSFGHIRLYLVPKLPSKPSTNLGAPHLASLFERLEPQGRDLTSASTAILISDMAAIRSALEAALAHRDEGAGT
ncbi:hypothetical protein O4H61_19340, partial [Roseovarius aestuarii]|nr:hypothetical protein [Roseovarius aestuarii]